MSVSAAIIVKDDANSLDACLASLSGLVDEIVVVDTGSSDDSIGVAERHGAIVGREPWRGDFSLARNRCLDLATGDWLLRVDPDEQVDGDFDAAREFLATADDCVACRVLVVPRVGWTPLGEPRLWRNRSDIRFEGHVHESVGPAIAAVAEREHLRVQPMDRFTIRNFGIEGARADKRAREEPLLLAEIQHDPNRAVVYDQLAQLYERAGDGERAITTWKLGIAVARVRDAADPDDRLLYSDLVQHLLAHGVIDDELEALVDEARRRFGPTPTIELAAARLSFSTGRPREALEPLEWLVRLDDDAVLATGASYDERVLGEWAWALLGLCLFELGDDAAAADAFHQAERVAPHDASYAVRRRLAEARAATHTP